jgi:hypothetical protein
MCSIIFQLGFLPFDEGSPARNGGLALLPADWKSFEQSVGPPGASKSAKATPLAEIATRVTESFGTVNGSVHQDGATQPATSAIFYTPSKRELIGRLWRFGVNRESSLTISGFELSCIAAQASLISVWACSAQGTGECAFQPEIRSVREPKACEMIGKRECPRHAAL